MLVSKQDKFKSTTFNEYRKCLQEIELLTVTIISAISICLILFYTTMQNNIMDKQKILSLYSDKIKETRM